MRSREKWSRAKKIPHKKVTDSGLLLKLWSAVVIPLIPPSFVLPQPCPVPFSLDSAQGGDAPCCTTTRPPRPVPRGCGHQLSQPGRTDQKACAAPGQHLIPTQAPG